MGRAAPHGASGRSISTWVVGGASTAGRVWSIATSPSSATEGTPTVPRTTRRWCRYPASSATARPRRFRVSRPSCATARRRARRTRTCSAHPSRRTRTRSAHRERPKPPRGKRPKPGRRQTRSPRKSPRLGTVASWTTCGTCLDRAFLFLLSPLVGI